MNSSNLPVGPRGIASTPDELDALEQRLRDARIAQKVVRIEPGEPLRERVDVVPDMDDRAVGAAIRRADCWGFAGAGQPSSVGERIVGGSQVRVNLRPFGATESSAHWWLSLKEGKERIRIAIFNRASLSVEESVGRVNR